MVKRIDFNADIGESFGSYQLGLDTEIVKYISSANIATGFHAGDPNWMRKTVLLAEEHGLGIGAHPSYPDLNGFGRREMTLSPYEIYNVVTYQIGALAAFVKGHKLRHVKPHGAMYNTAVKDATVAKAIVDSIYDYDSTLIHVVLAGSIWEKIAREKGALVARECFADRAVNNDGTLVSRNLEGSVIHDPNKVIERSVKLVLDGNVETITGELINFEADTICLHGDTNGSVELARLLRKEFELQGIKITKLSQMFPS